MTNKGSCEFGGLKQDDGSFIPFIRLNAPNGQSVNFFGDVSLATERDAKHFMLAVLDILTSPKEEINVFNSDLDS